MKNFLLIILMFISVPCLAQMPTSKIFHLHKIYTFVEKMPQFPGGKDSLAAFIKQNFHYPVAAKKNDVVGTVTITFVVDSIGEIGDLVIVKGLPYGCNDEAKRIVGEMPNWIPGKQNGNAVNVQVNLPFNFKMDD